MPRPQPPRRRIEPKQTSNLTTGPHAAIANQGRQSSSPYLKTNLSDFSGTDSMIYQLSPEPDILLWNFVISLDEKISKEWRCDGSDDEAAPRRHQSAKTGLLPNAKR
jgi:hypothetical protein